MDFKTKDNITLYYEYIENENAVGTVAFLNGIISSTESWQPFFAAVENAGFNILVHDFRGQLRSDKPDGPYTFEQHVADFVSLLDELNIDSVHLIGTSYGGIVALEMAIGSSKRVSSLSLISPLSEVDNHFSWIVREWMELSKKREIENFYNHLAPIIYSDSFFDNNNDEVMARKEKMKQLDDAYWDGLVKLFDNTLQNTNITSRLKKIKCPTFITVGDEDVLTPRKFAEIIRQNISNAEMVILPGCGHASFMEKPGLVSSLATGFMLQNA